MQLAIEDRCGTDEEIGRLGFFDRYFHHRRETPTFDHLMPVEPPAFHGEKEMGVGMGTEQEKTGLLPLSVRTLIRNDFQLFGRIRDVTALGGDENPSLGFELAAMAI